MSLKVITQPASEPVSLQEAKLHLRVIATASDTAAHPEDDLIKSLITAARETVENETGRALMTQTLELGIDCFVGVVKLPRPPLVSVTSVKYTDFDGSEQTLAPGFYTVNDYTEPAQIMPAPGVWLSGVPGAPNSVRIRYQAGYTSAALVPAAIKSWMLLRIGTLYASREDVSAGVSLAELPYVDRLLDAYRTYI